MDSLIRKLAFIMTVVLLSACDSIEEEAAFIQLGADDQLTSLAGLQYQLAFVVQVSDVDGNPVADSSVRIRIVPLTYRKGNYVWLDANNATTTLAADADSWGLGVYLIDYIDCPAEDSNHNAILDAGEDVNGNLILEPSNPATLTAHPSELPTLNPLTNRIVTNETGFGYFSITYPESVASWTSVRVIASTKVSGTESTQTLDLDLLPIKSDLEDTDVTPPGGSTASPYGTTLDCSVSG